LKVKGTFEKYKTSISLHESSFYFREVPQSKIFRLCWCFHQQIGRNFVGENTNKGEKIGRKVLFTFVKFPNQRFFAFIGVFTNKSVEILLVKTPTKANL
jgi:hypothetical protein